MPMYTCSGPVFFHFTIHSGGLSTCRRQCMQPGTSVHPSCCSGECCLLPAVSWMPPFVKPFANGELVPPGLYYSDWSMGELVMQKLGPVHSWGTCLKSHPNFPAPYGIGWGLCLNCSAVQLLPQPCSASQSFLLLQGLLLRALHSQTPAHEARPQSFSWAPNLEHWSTSFFLMVA